MRRLIDMFLPDGPVSPTQRRRMRAVVVGAVVTLPFGLIATQQIYAHIGLRDALFAFVALLVLATCPLLLRWTRSATFPGLLQASTLLGLLLLMAFLDGGLDDPSLYWTPLIPMAAAVTVGPLGTALTLAGGLAGLTALYALTYQGYAFPDYSAGALRFRFDVLSLGTGLLLSALVGWLYERHTRSELTRLSEGVRGLRGRLGRSEERYRQLFEHLPLGMYRTTPTGEVVLANAAFLRMLGYRSLADYHRECQHISDTYVNPADRTRLTAQLQTHGHVSQYELDLRARDGRLVHVRVNARTVTDADGAPLFFEGTIEDVTAHRIAQQQLRRSEERFRALVSHSNDVIAVLDGSGVITYLSPAAGRVLGLDPTAHVGRHVRSVLPADEERRIVRLLARALRHPGDLPNVEVGLQHARGHLVFVEVTGSNHLDDPDLGGLVLNLRDVTDRKRAEAVLLKSKEHAEEVARFKSSFLANMSHEIRTPLTGILGFASVLAEEIADEGHREFLHLISRSGERLMDTLNAVLDLARLEAGRMDLEAESLAVGPLVRTLVSPLEAQAQEKGLGLQVDVAAPEARALLDLGALDRIVTNLVDNAIKFTHAGEVRVAVEADPTFVRLVVRDTGPGIDEAFLLHIFSEFQQESEGVGRNFEGVGLGLTITQRLVEKLGGAIEVASTKGAGTTVTVTFPRSDTPATPPSTLETTAPSAQPRLLVVDDNQQTRFLLERMLHAHYAVDTAGTAEDTFSLTEQHAYDAILLDINLGAKTSGEDVMLRLREQERYAQTPIVAFTAYALPGDRERFLNQGFDGYLSKPFIRKQLMALLGEMLPAAADAEPTQAEPSLLLGPYAPRPTHPAPAPTPPVEETLDDTP